MGLQEGGILEKFYFDELNMPPRRPLPKYSNKPMNLEQLILPYALLGVGLFLSILTFLSELCWYKMGKNTTNENSHAQSKDKLSQPKERKIASLDISE